MKLYHKYRDDGVVVLGVHAWSERESKSVVREFVAKYQVTHPVLLGGREAHRKLYKCIYVPRLFFIDRRGRIAATKVGFDPGAEKDIEKTLRSLLQVSDTSVRG